MKQDALNVKDVNFREIKRKHCVLHVERRWKKIKLNDESMKRLIDVMSKSKNENKKINWENIASGVFNLKRTHVTTEHISCVKIF